jgi:hypothetical protein
MTRGTRAFVTEYPGARRMAWGQSPEALHCGNSGVLRTMLNCSSRPNADQHFR